MSCEILDKTTIKQQFPFKLNDESQSVSDKNSYGLDLLGFVREVPMLTTEESHTTPTIDSESKLGTQSPSSSSSLVLEGKKVIIKTNSMSGEKSLIFKQKTGQDLEIPARHCSFVKTSDTTSENAGHAYKVIETHFSRNSPPPLEPIVAPRLKPTLLKPKSELQYEIINKKRNKEGTNANNLLYRSRKDIQVYHWVTLPQSPKGRKLKVARRRVRRTIKTDSNSDPHYQIINKIRRRILKREQTKSESESDKACSPSEGSKSPNSSDCSKESRDGALNSFEDTNNTTKDNLGNNDKTSAVPEEAPAENNVTKKTSDTKRNTYVLMLGNNQLLQKQQSQTSLNIGNGQMLHSLLRMPPPLRRSVVKIDRAMQTPEGKSEMRSVGINTDESLFEEFLSKKLQEKLDADEVSRGDRIDSCSVVSSDDLVFDFYNFFDESSGKTNPIIGHNANFGNGPVMVGKSANNHSESVNLTDISYSFGKNISNGACGKQTRLEPWRIQFFLDLKHCNRFDSNGNMPIHVAVIEDNINRVRRQCLALHVRNISIDTLNHNSLTALQLGLLYDTRVSVLQTLITHNATPTVPDLEGNSVLHLAVLHSSDEAVQMLLGTCPNIPVDASNFEGDTALILCVLHKKYVKADRILQAGADPNIGDKKSGRTPLFHAIEANDVEMVKILLNYKAQTKVRNFFGTSPHDAMYELDSVDKTIRKLVLNKDYPPYIKKSQKGNKKRKAPNQVTNDIKTIRLD